MLQSTVFKKYHKPDALHDLVPFVQFKKREEHPWRSVTSSKAAGFRLEATNGTKSRNASHIYQRRATSSTNT